MVFIRYFTLLFMFFFMFSCTEKNITNQSTLGNIEGRVLIQNNTAVVPLQGTTVLAWGTSVYARTDSSGHFFLINLPEGTYDLEIDPYSYGFSKKIKNVSVRAGSTTNLSDIVLNGIPTILDPVYIKFSKNNGTYLYRNDTTVVDIDYVNADSFLLSGTLNYDYFLSLAGDTTMSVLYDGELYSVKTSKNNFLLKLPVKDHLCQIQIWEGPGSTPTANSFVASILITEKIRSHISLIWSTNDGNDAGDFDIHLINKEIQDSCWYRNPNPDWGLIGYSGDNPILYDETNFNGYDYNIESLNLHFTPVGTYRLKVVYFSNNSDKDIQVTPSIELSVDDIPHNFTAPSAMRVGQVWTICEFNIPSKTIIPINRIDSPNASQTERKRNIKTRNQKLSQLSTQ